MARSLQEFLNKLQSGGIRTQNMFEIEVYSGYAEVDLALRDITLYAQGFEIPDRKQNFVDISYKGYPIPIPTNMEMTREHSITINADIDGNIRKAFLKWQSMVTDPAIGNGSTFGGDKRIPKGSYVRVHLLGADMEKVVETYRLCGVSVESVGPLTVNNVGSEVSTFAIGLKSVYWELETTTGQFIGLK